MPQIVGPFMCELDFKEAEMQEGVIKKVDINQKWETRLDCLKQENLELKKTIKSLSEHFEQRIKGLEQELKVEVCKEKESLHKEKKEEGKGGYFKNVSRIKKEKRKKGYLKEGFKIWELDDCGTTVDKNKIQSITFLDSFENAPNSTWDVSELNDNSARAWVVENRLYIAGNGGLIAHRNCINMFYGFKNLEETKFGTNFDTSRVEYMHGMFRECEKLVRLDLSGFDTWNVTNMLAMFFDCSSLKEINVSGFDTSNVTNMCGMFGECDNLKELDISGFDTSKVTDMKCMFSFCSKLERLNVSGFDTSNVTSMDRMFAGCEKIKNLDVSGFDTSNVTNMKNMFWGCRGIKGIKTQSLTNGLVRDDN